MSKEAVKRGNELDVIGDQPKTHTFQAKVTPSIELKKKRKVAIIGTAPQWAQAPFDDPSWEIWGIYGIVCAGKRLDRIYELHSKEVIEEQSKNNPRYWEIVATYGDKYITKDHFDIAPNAKRFNFQSKIDKYGRYFASSASWLLAEAIDEGADEIGMWGINMASDSEYAHQKPSCTYLLGYAAAKGIKITIPPSSELLQVSHLYGLEPEPPLLAILNQKEAELKAALATHQANLNLSQMSAHGTQQALEMLKWYKQNLK